MLAGRLLVVVLAGGVDCARCSVRAGYVEDGNEEVFRSGCGPGLCARYDLDRLPNRPLWEWYWELGEWMDAGLPVAQWVIGWPLDEVRAWLAYRAAITAPVEPPQEAESCVD